MSDATKEKILLADDDELVRKAVGRILLMLGYEVETVDCGRAVIETVTDDFDVIILDINMQDMDGFQTLEDLNHNGYGIPVIFLTGAGSMDYAVKAINLGAYDFLTKPIEDIDYFKVKIKRALEKRRYVKQDRFYRSELEREVREKTQELAHKNRLLEEYSHHLEGATIQIMTSLQNAMEEKDYYTAGHTVRVTDYAVLLGKAIPLPEDELLVLRRASQFHDVGKLVIDLSCIQKAGKLTPEEWELIRKHPEVGANIIQPLGFMERERDIIRHHHERLDGQGYPDGIGDSDLDQLTRILTLADSYDAMTSRRNYRRNLTKIEAVAELRRCAGTQFDQELVEVFANLVLTSSTLFQS